jgi:hypothetical protein
LVSEKRSLSSEELKEEALQAKVVPDVQISIAAANAVATPATRSLRGER